MSANLEDIVNILLDIGIDNVTDMNNIIYLYQLYGIQVYDRHFIEDVEFIIIEDTIQIKDMYKVDINKSVSTDILPKEELKVLKKLVTWYGAGTVDRKSISNTILQEQNKIFTITNILLSILLVLLSFSTITLLVLLSKQVVAF